MFNGAFQNPGSQFILSSFFFCLVVLINYRIIIPFANLLTCRLIIKITYKYHYISKIESKIKNIKIQLENQPKDFNTFKQEQINIAKESAIEDIEAKCSTFKQATDCLVGKVLHRIERWSDAFDI